MAFVHLSNALLRVQTFAYPMTIDISLHLLSEMNLNRMC